MKILRGIIHSNLGISGIIISILSVLSIIYTVSAREEAFSNFENFKNTEHCFQGEKPDPEWNKMTSEEKKSKSDRCMRELNKLTQIKYGPYIFSFTLIIGIVLLSISLFQTKKEDDDNQLP
jgi:hypothetical protein